METLQLLPNTLDRHEVAIGLSIRRLKQLHEDGLIPDDLDMPYLAMGSFCIGKRVSRVLRDLLVAKGAC